MSENLSGLRLKLFGKNQKQPGIDNVIKALATDYSAVFVANIETEETKLIVLGDMFQTVLKKYNININSKAKYSDYIKILSGSIVHADDRENLCEFAFGQELKQKIAAGKVAAFEFRVDLGHNLRHIEIKVIPYGVNSPFEVVIGIRDVEKEFNYREESRQSEFEKQKNEEKYKYASVISEISGQYDYVGYFIYGTKQLESIYVSDDVLDAYENTDSSKPPYKRILELLRKAVYPADQKYFAEHITKDEIFKHIQTEGKYKVESRFVHCGQIMYYQLTFSEAAQRSEAIIFALANIDEEKRAEQRQATQEAMIRNLEDKAVITGLSDDYDAIMFVSNNGEGEEDQVTVYRMDEKITAGISEWHEEASFREKLMLLAEKVVYPDDSTEFIARTRKTVVLSHVKKEPAYYVEFRAVIDGQINSYQIKFVADRNEDNIITGFIVGISNIDERIHSKNIIKVLADNYEFVCCVYTVRNVIEVYRAGGAFSVFKKYVNWESKIVTPEQFDESFKSVIAPDDFDRFLKIVNREKIMALIEQGLPTYVDFKVVVGESIQWHRMEFAFDKSTKNVTIGIRNVEDERATSELLQKQKIELEKNEVELKKALDMAHSANRAKTTFLNNMSHDIRTPMNAIIGYTGLAKSHIDNVGQVADYLEKIDQASEHLLSLINDVLDMSRIESGKMTLNEKDESLYNIINTFSDMIQANVKEKHLEYSVRFNNITYEKVRLDKLRVVQVLLNIVSNAIKYTEEYGRITFDITQRPCEREGYGLYEFKIKDNGIGMSEEYVKTIFEPFTRENNATISGIQGTGLGMAIAKNIVDMMGGRIDVESKLKAGSTFKIYLEFEIADGAATPLVDIIQQEIDFEGKRILVVEDNDFNLEISTELLNDNGFVVLSARDGKEAVDFLRDMQPGEVDLVLMDIQMPIMDGYEATRKIRNFADKQKANIPIIAMTANAFEEDRKAAFDAGMNEHIAKPVNVDKLKDILKKFI